MKTATVELKNDYVLGFIVCEIFTVIALQDWVGWGIFAVIKLNSGVSRDSERWQPALGGTPRITGLAPVRILYRKKLQDKALFEIIR